MRPFAHFHSLAPSSEISKHNNASEKEKNSSIALVFIKISFVHAPGNSDVLINLSFEISANSNDQAIPPLNLVEIQAGRGF